jgi:hypothetical protein
VLDAIAAAIAGIEKAGLQTGISEIERRRIIQDEYENRSPFVSKESPLKEPSRSPSAASKGGCSSLIAVIGLCVLLVSLILMLFK